jgi:syntaxin 1B/2/3
MVHVDVVQQSHQFLSYTMEHDGGYGNARAILEECRKANVALDQLDKQLDNLKSLFLQVPARPNMPSNEINTLSSQIMTGYRVLVSGVKRIKSNPESGSPRTAPQVGLLDGRLKAAIQRYQTLKTGFRTDSQQAAKRQYRIVRPDATDAEVWEAVLDPAEPIFIQAVSIRRLRCKIPGRWLTSFSVPQLRLSQQSQRNSP